MTSSPVPTTPKSYNRPSHDHLEVQKRTFLNTVSIGFETSQELDLDKIVRALFKKLVQSS